MVLGSLVPELLRQSLFPGAGIGSCPLILQRALGAHCAGAVGTAWGLWVLTRPCPHSRT